MKSFEKSWKFFVVHSVQIVHNQTILTPSVEIVHTPYLKDNFEFFAALFLQLWNFRVFLFLTFFTKSINKVTRRDNVNWDTLMKLSPIPKLAQLTGLPTESHATGSSKENVDKFFNNVLFFIMSLNIQTTRQFWNKGHFNRNRKCWRFANNWKYASAATLQIC